MITVRKAQIPQYLQKGELYRILIENNDDPDEEVTFPGHVLKLNSSVQSTEDCDRLLDSVRFWGVGDFISEDLIAYVLHNPSRVKIVILQKYESEFKFVRVLREVAEAPEKRCDVAAKSGIVEIMSFLLAHAEPWGGRTTAIAAQHGHIPILRLLHDSGCEFGVDDMREAVIGGHLVCIKYMVSLNTINFTKNEHEFQDLCARHGYVDVLKYLFELGTGRSVNLLYIAAEFGYLNCLELAHEWNVPWNEKTCRMAALNGKLDCLKFAHDHGCPWNENTCSFAATNETLACLKFAHEHGCPWNERACACAARSGALACLVYLHEQGCPWDESACRLAAMGGQVECLQYLHEHGCPWNKITCGYAAETEHLDCLKYAHENGCPWDEDTCSAAALRNLLPSMNYGHKRGCPWDKNRHVHVTLSKEVDCLKYLHEHGCPWDEISCSTAAECGDKQALQYAHEHGCPLNLSSINIYESNPCYAYVQQHGTSLK